MNYQREGNPKNKRVEVNFEREVWIPKTLCYLLGCSLHTRSWVSGNEVCVDYTQVDKKCHINANTFNKCKKHMYWHMEVT